MTAPARDLCLRCSRRRPIALGHCAPCLAAAPLAAPAAAGEREREREDVALSPPALPILYTYDCGRCGERIQESRAPAAPAPGHFGKPLCPRCAEHHRDVDKQAPEPERPRRREFPVYALPPRAAREPEAPTALDDQELDLLGAEARKLLGLDDEPAAREETERHDQEQEEDVKTKKKSAPACPKCNGPAEHPRYQDLAARGGLCWSCYLSSKIKRTQKKEADVPAMKLKPAEAAKIKNPHCGHPITAVRTGDEGTSYCAECERESRKKTAEVTILDADAIRAEPAPTNGAHAATAPTFAEKNVAEAARMPAIQEQVRALRPPAPSTFLEIATGVGALVAEKNAAYGDSFAKCGDFLRLLYPDGIRPEQYGDALALVRIFDKQMRIATDKDALGESPYMDIAGYGILGAARGDMKARRAGT